MHASKQEILCVREKGGGGRGNYVVVIFLNMQAHLSSGSPNLNLLERIS